MFPSANALPPPCLTISSTVIVSLSSILMLNLPTFSPSSVPRTPVSQNLVPWNLNVMLASSSDDEKTGVPSFVEVHFPVSPALSLYPSLKPPSEGSGFTKIEARTIVFLFSIELPLLVISIICSPNGRLFDEKTISVSVFCLDHLNKDRHKQLFYRQA